MTLQQVFPGLQSAPAGAIVSVADNILDLSGPANRLTDELTRDYSNFLINQIRSVDPNYRFDSFGVPTTREGQANQIRELRLARAAIFYRARGETRPLQVETLRFVQEKTDLAYELGLQRLKEGRLRIRLSSQEALGNFVDRSVRQELQALYRGLGISTEKGQIVRVIGREYGASGMDSSYRIPDARVGSVAFDVTLTRKTLSTPQIQGFFTRGFAPSGVVVVRPSQLGSGNTYFIRKPGK